MAKATEDKITAFKCYPCSCGAESALPTNQKEPLRCLRCNKILDPQKTTIIKP